jgi:hypothetical protein
MALTNSRVWIPSFIGVEAFVLTGANYVIDASGEVVVVICRVPKTGTLDRFEAYIEQVSNAPDNGLRFSFQDVDLSNGQPDGVVDQSVTVASGSVVTGWMNPGNFGATRAVTRGDYLALVIDIPTFTAGDNVRVGQMTQSNCRIPYGIGATSTKLAGQLPIVALHYNDDSYGFFPTLPAINAAATETYHSGTAGGDEYGLAFMLPVPCTLNEVIVRLSVAAAADFDLVLYDASDSVLATLSYDDDVNSGAGVGVHCLVLQSAVNLSAATLYRLIIKPTTTNSVGLNYAGFASSTLMRDTIDGGTDLYLTKRVDAGAWTNYNNGTDGYRRPFMSLGLSALDDGTGGGGGGEVSHVFVG